MGQCACCDSRDAISEALKVPAIYGAVLGLIFNLSQVIVPDLLFNPLQLIGTMVIPLNLLVLGHRLASVRITDLSATTLVSCL